MRRQRQIKSHGTWYFCRSLIVEAIGEGLGHLLALAAAAVVAFLFCSCLILAFKTLQFIVTLFR